LKEEVLNETHELRLVVHPGSDEIYRLERILLMANHEEINS
jgi:hypothetical protein